MQTVQVNLGPSSYSLQITPGLLDDLQDLLPPAEGGVVILTRRWMLSMVAVLLGT